jgi:hypothetical protein
MAAVLLLILALLVVIVFALVDMSVLFLSVATEEVYKFSPMPGSSSYRSGV